MTIFLIFFENFCNTLIDKDIVEHKFYCRENPCRMTTHYYIHTREEGKGMRL